jgi:hypothetical protein
MPGNPSQPRPIRWRPWAILAIGIALVAFGAYWIAAAEDSVLIYYRNAAACTTAPWCGGGPPPAFWPVVWALSPFILVGVVVIVIGVVRLRQGRQARPVANAA